MDIYLREMKGYGHTKAGRGIFITAQSVIAPNWKQCQCLSVGE